MVIEKLTERAHSQISIFHQLRERPFVLRDFRGLPISERERERSREPSSEAGSRAIVKFVTKSQNDGESAAIVLG